MKYVYQVQRNDNVGTALETLDKGTHKIWLENEGTVGDIHTLSIVPKWFKVALANISEGQEVIKFGYPIGAAATEISKGCVVHRGNVVFNNHSRIMLDPLITERRFEIGKSKKLLWKGHRIVPGEDVVFESSIASKLVNETAIAASNIPPNNTIYCGNLLDQELFTLGPEQLSRIKAEYATIINEIANVDLKIFATDFHHIMRYYRTLKSDLFFDDLVRKRGK